MKNIFHVPSHVVLPEDKVSANPYSTRLPALYMPQFLRPTEVSPVNEHDRGKQFLFQKYPQYAFDRLTQ